jgi:Icc-related predicted phosphoesterase
MRLVFISDTHTLHDQIIIPDGDILLHCGDFSSRGRLQEVEDFLDWFGGQPHKYKVLIAGNHDFLAERNPKIFRLLVPENVIYLEDSGVEIEGIHIWGSPVQPWFFDWAFNRQRGAEIRKHWDLIPENTDVLITHGPPYGILDRVASDNRPVGCRDLLHRVGELSVKICAFGHIHEAYGVQEQDGVVFINASVLDEHYRVSNAPVVREIMSRT